jgi:molybdate transport system ATP-binding protein
MSVDVSICHRYGDFTLDVAFKIEQPGITALFGPSGAGKTSIINAIAGVLRPRRGRIVANDRVLYDTAANICIPPRQRRVGYVFQDARLFPHMSVERNLRFGWRRARERAPEPEVRHVIELLELRFLLARRTQGLSGGEKARVALGRALLASPDILLLDEPLAALDTARKNEIFPYLERLRDEARIPILLVSHSLDEVSRLAGHIVILRAGKVVTSGSVFDVLSDLNLPDYTGASPYGAVIGATVAENDTDTGLSTLAFPGGRLVVPLLERAIGEQLRVHVRAEDVMLSLEEPHGISANNILPAIVSGLRATTALHADIRLACGPTAILSRITRASCERLSLKAGMAVFAIVKSVTIATANDGPRHD